MSRHKLFVLGCCLLGFFQGESLKAIDVILEMPSGEQVRLHANPQDTLEEMISIVNDSLCTLRVPYQEELYSKAAKVRNYNHPVPESIINDIRFIILTLGNKPLLKLKKYESDLKSAGDRLENIHPLNIWRTIFTDNEMISAMYNIKKRSKVWGSFIKGMAKSLDEAQQVNDLKSEYIEDFCDKINVKSGLLISYINTHDWEGMIKQILNHIPRDGEPDRYDQ